MAKIQMVGTETCEGEGMSGVLLVVHFVNGQTILLPLRGKAGDPAFDAMLKDGRLYQPETDGERVYWQDGPSLSCAKIMQMLKGDAG